MTIPPDLVEYIKYTYWVSFWTLMLVFIKFFTAPNDRDIDALKKEIKELRDDIKKLVK